MLLCQGKELTAYDVAILKGHEQCAQLLHQHGALSAADLLLYGIAGPPPPPVAARRGTVGRPPQAVRSAAVGAWRSDMRRAVDAAVASAKIEAEYWLADERELQERAAEIVRQTMLRATEQLTREKLERELEEKRRREERRRAKAVLLFLKIP